MNKWHHEISNKIEIFDKKVLSNKKVCVFSLHCIDVNRVDAWKC